MHNELSQDSGSAVPRPSITPPPVEGDTRPLPAAPASFTDLGVSMGSVTPWVKHGFCTQRVLRAGSLTPALL